VKPHRILGVRTTALVVAQIYPATCLAEGVLYFDAGGTLAGLALYAVGFAVLVAGVLAATSEAKLVFISALICYLVGPTLYVVWSVAENNAKNSQLQDQAERRLAETRETLTKFCREYKGNAVPACEEKK
jgi:hypothetical protein